MARLASDSCGFVSVASVSPRVAVASPQKNVEYILEELRREELKDCACVVFPELSLTGYTCGDLFFQQSLLDAAEDALLNLCEALEKDARLVAVGLPLSFGGSILNCAAVLCRGRILGVVPKSFIPNYQEFYEKRWFASGKELRGESLKIGSQVVPIGTDLLFEHCGVKIGVEICEDLWVPNPPSSSLCMNGAELILNLSATDDNLGKYDYIKSLVASQSARCRCAYAYASAGNGESSTDLVFSGINLIACDGNIQSESQRFEREDSIAVAVIDVFKLRNDRRKYSTFFEGRGSEVFRTIESGVKQEETVCIFPHKIEPHPFIPEPSRRNEACREIVNIQSWGLAQRLTATGCKNIVVGVSGGLDSTLALLVAHFTFRKLGLPFGNILAVTMPADATSERTRSNARVLIEKLGATFMEVPIREAVNLHFRDIGQPYNVYDAVYENSQARERTQILMDLANKVQGMVLGTGDMSEIALGWCTYNGDHMSMYNVNGGVPKTLVKYLVGWFADTTDSEELRKVLIDIIDTPISPELVPSGSGEEIAQKTEELVGPYELHDFFLFHVLRNGFTPSRIFALASSAFEEKYTPAVIKKWLLTFYKRFFSQQFKRSCMPDGPKIGSVCLSPRGDWRMPSDAAPELWVNEVENIKVD